MGKKKKKKNKKISKAQILQATRQSQERVEAPYSPGPVATNAPAMQSTANSSMNQYGGIFDHVKTDMTFFIIMTIVFAVILAIGYFVDQQTGFVLTAGNALYNALGL